MWEETLGFFVLLVPLALALGYDRMVAAAIIFLGAGTGVLCSTVNPFATGVASDAAGISLGDGIGVRIAMWVVLVAMAIGYVIRYARAGARRTRRGRSSAISPTDAEDARGPDRRRARRSPAARSSCSSLFVGSFLVMIYGFIPWNDLWQEGWGKDFPLPTFGVVLLPRGGGAVLRDGGRRSG